jgi:hypothetical protein
MPDRAKPTQVAKDLGVRPQIIYGLIKRGKIKTFDNPAGGTALVDVADTKIAISRMGHRGPRKDKPKKGQGLGGGIKRGTIVSTARYPTKGAFAREGREGRSVRTVTDGTMNLVWLSDGTIETVWPTDSLREAVTNGRAKIETPASILGTIMYQWDHDGKAELAESLRQWAIENSVGFYPIETQHDLMKEEQEAEGPKKVEVEVELTEGGIDVAKVLAEAGV